MTSASYTRVTQAYPAAVVPDSEPASEPAEPGAASRLPGSQRVDRWGNTILSGPRLDGAYTMRSWRRDGRAVYVCGEPGKHVAAGMWKLDGRMERGQGYVCCACFPIQAGLYGISER